MLSAFTSNIEEDFDINPKEIGRGGFGYVQEAHRKSDNKRVAVKTMIHEQLDLDSEKSLLRELQLLASVDHPKCLQLIAFNLDPVPKIVTPFMGNGDLNDILVSKAKGKCHPKFTPTRMMCSLYGICSTMHFLHSHCIIHRDFKPLNVFIDDNFDICIADFGLARRVSENVQMTMGNIGSPLYTAPETFSDEYDAYTNKIDVFSFGTTYMQYFVMPTTLNDKKGRIKSQQNLKLRVSKGARFIQPEGMNDDQYKLYLDCVDQNPNFRPSFLELCERFETQESIWFPGTNKDEYFHYINECKEILREKEEKTLKPSEKAKPKPKHKPKPMTDY